MTAKLFRFLKRTLLLMVVVAATLLAVRAYDSQRGAPLQLWHTYVPHEMRAAEIDKADWPAYLKAEDALFRDVRAEVIDKLEQESRNASNRYFAGSPIYPGQFQAGLVPLLCPRARRTAESAPWCCCMA